MHTKTNVITYIATYKALNCEWPHGELFALWPTFA